MKERDSHHARERNVIWHEGAKLEKRLEASGYESLRGYLQSAWFKELREHYLKTFNDDEPNCELCGSTRRLRLRHRMYDRLGEERMSDLILLCANCQDRVARLMKMQEEAQQKCRTQQAIRHIQKLGPSAPLTLIPAQVRVSTPRKGLEAKARERQSKRRQAIDEALRRVDPLYRPVRS